jgi:hypothetical protein
VPGIRNLETSYLLSCFTIIGIVLVNWQIAERYLASDGKTQALFGIIEVTSFWYKYFLLLPASIALLLGVMSFRRVDLRIRSLFAVILAVIAISLVLLRVWTAFV